MSKIEFPDMHIDDLTITINIPKTCIRCGHMFNSDDTVNITMSCSNSDKAQAFCMCRSCANDAIADLKNTSLIRDNSNISSDIF